MKLPSGFDQSCRGKRLDSLEWFLDGFMPTCTRHRHRNQFTAWLCGKYMTLLYTSSEDRDMYRAVKEARTHCNYWGPNP